MSATRHRFSRFLTDAPPQGSPVTHARSDFYREEFIKCQQCLEAHRELYSEGTISEVQRALTRVMSQLDRLCTKADSDRLVSELLGRFDVLARLSVWSDPRQVH
jgi:hypothetical protein